jgi:hypothetical protein
MMFDGKWKMCGLAKKSATPALYNILRSLQPKSDLSQFMMIMDFFFEILKYILPAAIAIAGVYLVIHRFFQQETRKMDLDRQQALRRETFPVRMQAYERVVLLLERISLNQLILRVSKPGLIAVQFQALLIHTIREEFDHNLSQQVYISSKAWELVKTAREEMIRLINTAAGKLPKESPSADLAGQILELYASLEDDPVSRAIEFVKQEARRFL